MDETPLPGRATVADGRPRWRARSALAALVGLAGLAGLAAAGAGRLARRWCRGTALGTALVCVRRGCAPQRGGGTFRTV